MNNILFTSNTIGEGWGGDNLAISLYTCTVKGTLYSGDSFTETNKVNLIRNCIGSYLDVSKLVFRSMLDPISATLIFPSNEISCP